MKRGMALLLAALLLLSGCASAAPPAEIQSARGELFAMDTYMTIACCGEQCEEALAAAVAEIRRLDALLSVGEADSEISRLNARGGGRVSGDTRAMLETALALYAETDGAFDLTVFPLMELWGFPGGQMAVPEAAALQEALAAVGMDRLALSGDELRLAPGQGIDLGGIAKGYTSDRLMEIFAEYSLRSALVSLGGNIHCFGTKPDGSPWRCGIRDPFSDDSGSWMAVLTVADRAVVTSGGYERFFIGEDGRTCHHILDPATGWPAESGLVSATVVSRNGMQADALSTACYVMGLERAAAYWRAHSGEFDLILITEDGDVYITEPLEEQFTTDWPLYILRP